MANSLTSLQMTGIDEMQGAFRGLEEGMARRGLASAVRKAGRIMVNPLKENTPIQLGRVHVKKTGGLRFDKPSGHPGEMRASTGMVVRAKSLNVFAVIGHKWPKGAGAHLIEHGTVQRQTKSGANRGKVTPRPFLRPVFQQYRSQMMAKMQASLTDDLERERQKALSKSIKQSGI